MLKDTITPEMASMSNASGDEDQLYPLAGIGDTGSAAGVTIQKKWAIIRPIGWLPGYRRKMVPTLIWASPDGTDEHDAGWLLCRR